MNRRGKLLLFLPALLILLFSASMAWLLRTESGANWLFNRISQLVPGELQVESLNGKLSQELVLNQLSFEDESVRLDAPQLRLRLNFALFPPALNLDRVSSTEIRLQLLEGDRSEASIAYDDILTSLQLPFPVRIGHLELHRLAVLSAAEESLFQAENVLLQAAWYRSMDIKRLSMINQHIDWALAADLQLDPPFKLVGKLSARAQIATNRDPRMPVTLQTRFDGDLGRLAVDGNLDLPQITISGELRDLLSQPGWQLQLQSTALSWPVSAQVNAGEADQAEGLILQNLLLESQGNLQDYSVQLDTQVRGNDLPTAQASLHGNGNASGLLLDALDIAGEELELSGTGSLDWSEALTISTDLDIRRLLPGRWLPGWPESHTVFGQLDLDLGENRIGFKRVHLNVTDLPLEVSGEGEFDLEQNTVSGQLDWLSLAWPLGSTEPDWSSDRGAAKLSGQPEDWQAQGQLHLLVQGFPEGNLELQATGNTEALHLQIDRGALLGGQFNGTADYQWAEPARWSTDLQASQINITPLAPEYPGVLSGKVVASGDIESGDLQLELNQVRGEVRGLPVSADGKLHFIDSLLQADALVLRSGSARLELDGSIGIGQVLRFDARADQLADLWPQASGKLDASGELSLDANSPKLDISINADQLSWGDYQVNSVRTETAANGDRILRIDRARLDGTEVEDLQLSLSSMPALERVELRGLIDTTQLEASLSGKLTPGADGLISGWEGYVQNLRLSRPEMGFLALQSPTALSLEPQKASLGEACVLGPQNGLICMQGEWSDQGSQLLATVQQVSLDVVRLFVDMDWAFTHRLDGTFEWQKPANKAASSKARVTISPGELLFDEEETNFKTGAGLFAFQVSEGSLHSGQFDLPIEDSGKIDLDFSIPNLDAGAAANVEARIAVSLKELAPLQQIIPHFEVVRGELNADIRVGGTLEDPQFTGHATLVRAYLEDYSTGMVLSDIQLAGAVYQYDHTELFGSFRAGEGRGQIKADLRFDDFLDPQLDLYLQGDQLLLVNVPDLNLTANPDLQISWAGGLLTINGRVLVPSAQLSPRYLPTSTASESPDLVIVSHDPDAKGENEAEPETPAKPVRVTGQVEIELGKQVNVTLDKATANIRGKTNFIWNNEMLPTGDGAFTLSGEIYAYGQLLSISEGRVSFPRSPADNPYLNIKAEREIYGNSQVRKAGVLVTGTLKRPILEPYTNPLTTKERALTLLITGNDFDYEQGVGAVEVGMYVAPKLFISYGIGLFEDQNVISARYDLGRGFGVKATSGQRETGVDISYTIEQ